jgi:uncharacterized membrane protein YtjA (UPF0391 family)
MLSPDTAEGNGRSASLKCFYKENSMLSMALVFLVIALIAGALGVFPVQALSVEIAWILFVVFLILFVVSLVLGRRAGPPV